MTVDVAHPFDLIGAKNRPTIITLNLKYCHTIPLILRSRSLPPLLSPICVVIFVVALVAVITVVGIVEREKSSFFPRIDCTGDCNNAGIYSGSDYVYHGNLVIFSDILRFSTRFPYLLVRY
jgi:hypothetical protein